MGEAIEGVTKAVEHLSKGVDVLVDTRGDEERQDILAWLTPVDYDL